MKILVLGITGMLGHKAFSIFSENSNFDTFGTARKAEDVEKYFKNTNKIFSNIDALNPESIFNLVDKLKPDIILNCIGIIKQLKEAIDPILSIEINSLFPHRLANHITSSKTRLIHISTDCVFSGDRGNYKEVDNSDAKDLYGKSKYLGELINYDNCITLRTSIIGPELKGKLSLLEWFLAQKKPIKGFTNAIYSGFTTFELINIIENNVIKRPNKNGLYNISSNPISKYELLKIIAKNYNINNEIKPYEAFKNNKSLNSDLFKKDFGYVVKPWNQMILEMFNNSTKDEKSNFSFS
jgi:dTDP-4-dehydrorhamnose reductase